MENRSMKMEIYIEHWKTVNAQWKTDIKNGNLILEKGSWKRRLILDNGKPTLKK